MASIHERKTKQGKRWDVKWRDHDDPKQNARTFHTAEAARIFRREVERARDERRPYCDPKPDRVALKLLDLATAYLVDRKRVTKSEGGMNIRNYAISMFVAYLEDTTGEVPEPRHLTRAALGEYHAFLQSKRVVTTTRPDGKAYSQPYQCSMSTANARVRHVEAWWKWLSESDEYGDDIPRPKRIDLIAPDGNAPAVAPTWAEMDAAIRAAPPAWARLFTVMRFTGLRSASQAIRLKLSDVNLTAATLRIRGELGKSTKERAGRTVPISLHLVEAIKGWPLCPDGYLVKWDTRAPGQVEMPKREIMNRTARVILKRAGVRAEIWETKKGADGLRRNAHPLHCFRAGVISELTRLGVKEAAIQVLVGHAGSVTRERYTDEDAHGLRAVVDLIPPLTAIEQP